MSRTIVFAVVGLCVLGMARGQIDQSKTREEQIEEALGALPASLQDGATVRGYDETGAPAVLREGTSDIICRADDPNVRAWNVACYPRSLEPLMERSHELTKAGADTPERIRTLKEEIASGAIEVPTGGVVYTRSGNSADVASGAIVLHVPNATRESSGLPTLPSPGWPWLAEAGTPMANIRIAMP